MSHAAFEKERLTVEKKIRKLFKHVMFITELFNSDEMSLNKHFSLQEVTYELSCHPGLEKGNLYLASKTLGDLNIEFLVYRSKSYGGREVLIFAPDNHPAVHASIEMSNVDKALYFLPFSYNIALKTMIPVVGSSMYDGAHDLCFIYIPAIAAQYSALDDPAFLEDRPIVIDHAQAASETKLIVVRSKSDGRLYTLVPKSADLCGFQLEIASPPLV